MIIAVDFDGTIVEHKFPKIGDEIPFALETLRKIQANPHHRLILWTMRTGKELNEAVEYCRERGVIFYAHNENYPSEKLDSDTPRKVAADLYIDDRNIGGLPDWGAIYQMIKSGNPYQPYANTEGYYPKSKKKGFFAKFFGK
ncbi:MAG: hypothetical protein LBN27_09660 [Prevotellaceae bacterium]|jgi:hypothetical protein|nr:hypothetical protein [Prevotellaceae bacterium]